MPFRTFRGSTETFIRITALTLLSALWTGVALAGEHDDDRDRDPRIRRGFEIAPVQLNLNGKDPNLVGLGSYLVNAVAGCNDCMLFTLDAEIRRCLNGLYAACFFAGCANALELLCARIAQA